jgi:hypothetical protein
VKESRRSVPMGIKNGRNRIWRFKSKVQKLILAKILTTNIIGCCEAKISGYTAQ